MALIGIVAWGAWLRFRLPQTPLSDPDTWGYLRPALSELLGQGFIHTYGRNFVYPGWLYLVLRLTGDFRAIGVAQHLLGLGTGLLLWAVWQRWRQWTRETYLPGWAAPLLGLAMVAFYLGSVSVLLFEQEIRPESIFPFFAIVTVWLELEFLRAWFVTKRRLAGSLWCCAALFSAVLVYQIKPSFGLALGVAGLPWLGGLLAPHQSRWDRLRLAGAGCVAGLAAFLFLLSPERRLAQRDETSAVFLPQVLLTVHAKVIVDQMARDLRAGNPTPYTNAWLASLHDHLDNEMRASAKDGRIYPSLGFNPDYLIYQRDSFCHFLKREMSVRRLSRLGFYYYFRAWRQQPSAMLGAVLDQLAIFYSWECPAFWPRPSVDLAKEWHRSLDVFSSPGVWEQLQRLPASRAYADRCRQLGSRQLLLGEPAALTYADTIAGECHSYLLVIVGVALGIIASLKVGEAKNELLISGLLVLFFALLNFGACLTVAIVHSFDIDRYSINQFILALLFVFAAFVWCCDALIAAWQHLPKAERMGAERMKDEG